MNENQDRSDEIKRTWWERPLLVIWVILEIIFLQSTIASYQELEPRAAALFAGMFFTLLISGLIVRAIRKNRLI
ncbi:MAG: hypothetical protein DWQ04_26920 [Chloroflexi bacterium]|nr:MAG: hypothetical protein DWQ04_26920 [Chloroflexota bacterium]